MSDLASASPLASRRSTLPISRVGWLVFLVVCTFIPMMLVAGLINDREGREMEARNTIAQSWGPAQTIGTPTLVVAIRRAGLISYIDLAPTAIDVSADLLPQQRRRGLFTATVYEAAVTMRGQFVLSEDVRPKEGWADADVIGNYLALHLTDLSGVQGTDGVTIGGVETHWQVCGDLLAMAACQSANLVVPLEVGKTGDTVSFEAHLHVRGTQALRLAAVSKQMTAVVKGGWTAPSFIGDDLPATIIRSGKGFEAQWHVDTLGKPRLQPSRMILDPSFLASTIGVDLLEPMPTYKMIDRAVKYAPLLIILAFSTYVVFELLSGIRITLLQYALLGGSLTLFTLLLLSLSEIVGYAIGYTLSASLVLVQASIYTASVATGRTAMVFAAVLATLFGCIYVLLGLETYALVVGSVALFLVLSIVMAVTQRLVEPEPDERPA
jgi:inner membrane protein